MTTKEITVQEKAISAQIEAPITTMKPSLVIERAREAARVLVEVVKQKPNPVLINSEQYLEYEDWQMVGEFYRYAVRTGDAVPVEINGVQGAKAHADLIRIETGDIVGGAEAYCMRDEEKWNTKAKYEWHDDQETGERKRVKVGDEIVPWFQLASMAQTRAGAKAYRNRLAWVVVLAGYKPTPAEELTDNTIQRGEETHKRDHWCSVHKKRWFKSGKMKSYAHPIGDSGEWCSEPEAPVKTKEQNIADKAQPVEPQPSRAGDSPSPSQGQGLGIPPTQAVPTTQPVPGTISKEEPDPFRQARWVASQKMCRDLFDRTPPGIDAVRLTEWFRVRNISWDAGYLAYPECPSVVSDKVLMAFERALENLISPKVL